MLVQFFKCLPVSKVSAELEPRHTVDVNIKLNTVLKIYLKIFKICSIQFEISQYYV